MEVGVNGAVIAGLGTGLRAGLCAGLCARAGKVLSGEPAAEQAVKKKNAYLVLIDEEASENAKKALSDACAYYGAPLRTLPAGCLGQAIGKPGRMAAAITDQTLAKRLIERIECQ